ncbi:MAG: 23S rRNA (uracil(1939)-C(5))-methyltransferase RlmD, partial [Emergencia sp.]|nr:23S rRNA (uracil(1939)-C(5))-methyltransferase RlmD [Emergencia sp.]
MEDFNKDCLAVCVHDEFCGGCVYQGMTYEEQLALKEGEVRQFFSDRGIKPEVFDPIEGCPAAHKYRYRNKMEYTFGDFVKDGPTCLGMHKKKNFMSIITVDQCQLVDEDFNKILKFNLEFAQAHNYKHYNKKSHKGLLRNLVIRKGIRTGELLVNLVTTREEEFDEAGYVEGLQALSLDNHIVGILRTLNDNIADKVTCEELKILWGRDYYMEEILGLKFKVSAFSFFQTNVEAVERLYSEALALIDDFSGKKVFDLYCGTGTISQVLALKAKEVTGVEIVEEAVEAAKVNAQLNQLSNCNFIAGDVFEVLSQLSEKPEVIVVDPPRVGMSMDAVEKIISYGVQQIVYISCNPKSLALNLQQFIYNGYEVKYAKPFDNFPWTKHVETVVMLSHKKPDSVINVKVEFGEGEGKVPLD